MNIVRTKLTLLFLVMSFLAASCTQGEQSGSEVKQWEKQAERVTITRDTYGVPHIFGETDADAVFGLMYAQCEDDFNRVEVNYINSLGRMAEVEGENQLFTDLRMKLYIDPEEVKREYESSAPWLRKLMDAFADGINYYLYTHPEVEPKLITHFEPWMALTFSEGSIGGDIEQISPAGLKRFYGDPLVAQIAEEPVPEDQEPRGSNGFAIAPSLTESGDALLLINPHTSIFFRSEVHMVSKEGLNAYGAVTWGQFFIYQGFNEKCGWMHTSSRADVIDYYLETVVEKEGKYFYKYGEELRPFTEKVISLPYKDGDEMSEKKVTVYYSHHGPVIRENEGKWVAIRLMVEHEKALTQSYMRTKATGYSDFRETMNIRTNSSNNTVYADAEGNIAYFHGNFMPRRDPSFDWSGPVDGSNPATEWKGLHELDEMILLLNPQNGWIQNCNSTPFTSAGEYSPHSQDFPAYMAPDAENQRGIHAVKVLKDRNDFNLDRLIEAAYDPFLPAFEHTIPALVAAYDRLSRNNPGMVNSLGGAIDMLRSWDFCYSLSSIPTTLAIFWGQDILRSVRSMENPSGKEIFDFIASDVQPDMLVISLYNAVNSLEHDFGTWEIPWGDINRFQRLTGDIVQNFSDEEPSLPVFFASSQWGSLASFGARTYPGTRKMYGTSGNSFVAVVEFGDRVKARSILAGGISGDPGSPHFSDQALMYTIGEFKDVRFYPEDIEANSERTYKPGN